jgi:hypothetical protein
MKTTSPHSSLTDVIDVPPDVADAAARLAHRVPQLASAIAYTVRDEIDELRDDSLSELHRARSRVTQTRLPSV